MGELGRCDFKQYEHCGPHERISDVGQRMPPFGCKNWKTDDSPVLDSERKDFGRMAEATAESLDSGTEAELNLDSVTTLPLARIHNAWLSPRGEIITDHEDFEPGGAYHEDLAACIVKDLLRLKTLHEARAVAHPSAIAYIYEYLEERGWIRLCGRGTLPPKWIVPNRVTSQQRETIEAWCGENGTTWNQSVEEIV